MKYHIKILDVKTIHEIDGAWSNEDFIALLDLYGFSDAGSSAPDELKDLLFMAISDFEPEEAAEIMLNYKFGDRLKKGQIQNLSETMTDDKVAEEYQDISLHQELYNVNQLLLQAYNGKFPDTKATQLKVQITAEKPMDSPVSKETFLKALNSNLGGSNLVKRLFEDQLEGKIPFPEAESILWIMEKTSEDTYTIITSDYWINDEDIQKYEFEAEVK